MVEAAITCVHLDLYLVFTLWINPLALRAAKTGLTILLIFSSQKRFYQKIFEEEMFIRILPTTLLQIFCENLLYFQVILKSMKIADDTYLGNSECEWLFSYELWYSRRRL